MRRRLTPADFRTGGESLINKASHIENYVKLKKMAGQQQQSRTEWLLAQQRLSQEADDCAAELDRWLGVSSVLCELAGAASMNNQEEVGTEDAAPNDTRVCTTTAPEASQPTGSRVEEAAAVATEVAGLLACCDLDSIQLSAEVQILQDGLNQLQRGMKEDIAASDAAAAALLRQSHKQFAAAARPTDSSDWAGGSLQAQLQQMGARFPLASGSYKQQLAALAEDLELRHSGQRQQGVMAWQAFQAATAAACGSQQQAGAGLAEAEESDGCCVSATCDGWATDEHAVFLHARSTCMAVGGGGEPALVRQLAALLPARAQQEVLQHDKWHREAGRLCSTVRQLEAGWRQESAAFLSSACQLLQEAEAGVLTAAQAAVCQLEAAVASVCCAEAAAGRQFVQQQAGAAEQLQTLQAAAANAAQLAAQKQAEGQYRERMKQLLEQYRQRQEQQAAERLDAERAAAAAAAQEVAAAAAVGRQRVQYRKQQEAERQALRRQQEAQRQQEQERRQQALELLRREVAPAVQRDARRARAPTLSSCAAAATSAQPHGLFAQALGFTTDQLLADQRFKVYEALRLMGLHATSAGRQAVAGARPARAPRPDTLTSAQRQGNQKH